MYPVNLAGTPGALIFFCFFSCIKARKEVETQQLNIPNA